MTETRPKLFQDVFYYMSKTLPVEQSKQLAKVLELNGGKAVLYDDNRLTHYITNSPPGKDSLSTLPEGSSAHLVTPQWIERSLILSSRQDPQFYSADPAMLFSGVIATATDLSQTDNEVLCAGITSLGGQWRTAFTKDVTHLFAMTTSSAKYNTAMHFRDVTGVRVVVPHWFDDIVRMGIKGLPTEPYEFPSPKVFKEYGAQAIRRITGTQESEDRDAKKNRPLSPHKKALYDTALSPGSDLPDAHPASDNIWHDMKLLLSSTLELNRSQREAHKVDIERAGGRVLDCDTLEDEVVKVDEADIFITRYRSGPAYVRAYRSNKTIGTLPWLWYVRSTGVFSRPTDQLLHYPIPRNPIEGFSRHVITVTNYTGRDREYIKKLIIAMGAEFTPSMSGRNTIVVAAYLQGTKTTKAVSWNIPVVQHLWLEDCFTQWRDIPPAHEKYIVFPPSMDFGATIAQKGLGEVVYDDEELAALEKEQLMSGPGDGELSTRPPLASQPVAESPRKRRKGRDTDIDAADVSGSAYLDIDVPIDDEGRLSDIDMSHDYPGDEVDMDDSPSARKSKTGKNTSIKPKSILRAKGKARADDDSYVDEAQELSAALPSTPKRKTVKRFGRRVDPKSGEVHGDRGAGDAVSVESPPPQVNGHRSLGHVRSPRKAQAVVEAGDGKELSSSPRKLLVKKTYQAKSRSRSRSRVRDEDSASGSEVEVTPSRPRYDSTRGRAGIGSARARSRSLSQPREDDEGVQPRGARELKAPKSPPKRGRGRPRKVALNLTKDEDVLNAHIEQPRSASGGRFNKQRETLDTGGQSVETNDARAQPRSRGRPPRRQLDAEHAGAHRAEVSSENVISTRSRSRNRSAQEDNATPLNKGSEPEDEIIEDKEPTLMRHGAKRKKPPLPCDSESEQTASAKRSLRREDSIRSAAEVEGSSRVRAMGTPRRPRNEVSVVLPTLKQVRSQSQVRSEEDQDAKRAQRRDEEAGRSDESPRRGLPSKASIKPRSSQQETSPSIPKRNRAVVEIPADPSRAVPDTPASAVRSSKRSAANRATEKLHNEVMPDVLNFQRELKSGHVKSSYDRVQANVRNQERDIEVAARTTKSRKRTSTEDVGDAAEPDKKKAKHADAKPGLRSAVSELELVNGNAVEGIISPGKSSSTGVRDIVVLATQVTFTEDMVKAFAKLGGKFTQKPAECTHLVAKNFVRTEKFLCGMAIASHVVNANWVEMSVLKRRILPEEDFPLNDPAGEAKFGVKLADVLRRRRTTKGKVFKGLTFYVTPKIPIDFKLLKNVVMAGGGQILPQSPTSRILKGHPDRFVISHQSDVSIWRPLVNSGYPIYSQELILTSALKQQIDWDSEANQVPGSF